MENGFELSSNFAGADKAREPLGSPLASTHRNGQIYNQRPWWIRGFIVSLPIRPAPDASGSGSCTSARTFAPRFLQTPPCGDALALRYHFTYIRL